jgi:hypothetical protein
VEVNVESTLLSVEDSSGGRRIEATVNAVGEDLVIVVGGGERPHVGCVVLAQPGASKGNGGSWSASCSVLTIPPHKEEPIARGIASRIAEEFGTVTVVTAGIHEDNLDPMGIAAYLRLGEELANKIVSEMASVRSPKL